MLNTGSGFYAYATNGAGSNVQVMTSPDLLTWETATDALPAVASWAAAGHTWSPCVLPWGDIHVMFYACREPRAGRQAISVATAARPGGPFRDSSSRPLVYQLDLGGSIDPSPFVDADGTPYLLWKADSNAIGRASSIWLQAIRGDGVGLAGTPVELLRHDERWERPLVEAPSLVRHRDLYHLFYSANRWNSGSYAVGYATATEAGGPYTKVTTSEAWLSSDENVAGPGGQEWFTDSSGQLRMCYHGWTPGRVGYPLGARSLRIAAVDLTVPIPSAS